MADVPFWSLDPCRYPYLGKEDLSHTETQRHGVKNSGKTEIERRRGAAFSDGPGAQGTQKTPPTSAPYFKSRRNALFLFCLLRDSVSPCEVKEIGD